MPIRARSRTPTTRSNCGLEVRFLLASLRIRLHRLQLPRCKLPMFASASALSHSDAHLVRPIHSKRLMIVAAISRRVVDSASPYDEIPARMKRINSIAIRRASTRIVISTRGAQLFRRHNQLVKPYDGRRIWQRGRVSLTKNPDVKSRDHQNSCNGTYGCDCDPDRGKDI